MKCNVHQDRDAIGTCVDCGRAVCAECGRERGGKLRCETHDAAAAAAPPAAPISPFTAAPAARSRPYSPAAAFWLNFCPGLGHVYLGLYQRGIKFFIGVVALITLSSITYRAAGVFGVGAVFVWLWAAFDARRCAMAINGGFLDVAGANSEDLRRLREAAGGRRGTGALFWGIILIGVGGLAMADRYMDMDRFWDFVDNAWPAVLIILGLALIIAYFRSKSSPPSAGAGPTSTPPPGGGSGPIQP